MLTPSSETTDMMGNSLFLIVCVLIFLFGPVDGGYWWWYQDGMKQLGQQLRQVGGGARRTCLFFRSKTGKQSN